MGKTVMPTESVSPPDGGRRLGLTRADRLFSNRQVGFAVQICQLWGEKAPGLTKLVSPYRLCQSYEFVREKP